MSFINRQPTGWLGFLGIKNFGRNPANTSDVLAPTWDLSDLYLSASRQWISTGATITASLAYNMTGQVPAGEVWYVHAYGYRSNLLIAGNTLEIQIAMGLTSTNTYTLIGPSSGVRTVNQVAITYLPRPVLLNPSETLGVYVAQFAGANIGVEVNLCITRLQA